MLYYGKIDKDDFEIISFYNLYVLYEDVKYSRSSFKVVIGYSEEAKEMLKLSKSEVYDFESLFDMEGWFASDVGQEIAKSTLPLRIRAKISDVLIDQIKKGRTDYKSWVLSLVGNWSTHGHISERLYDALVSSPYGIILSEFLTIPLEYMGKLYDTLSTSPRYIIDYIRQHRSIAIPDKLYDIIITDMDCWLSYCSIGNIRDKFGEDMYIKTGKMHFSMVYDYIKASSQRSRTLEKALYTYNKRDLYVTYVSCVSSRVLVKDKFLTDNEVAIIFACHTGTAIPKKYENQYLSNASPMLVERYHKTFAKAEKQKV